MFAGEAGGGGDPRGRGSEVPPPRLWRDFGRYHPCPARCVTRRFAVRSSALLVLAFSLISGVPGAPAAGIGPTVVDPDGRVVTATYEGRPIDPVQASHYFCHTRDYPIVRCFASQAEVDRDLDWIEPQGPGGAPANATP